VAAAAAVVAVFLPGSSGSSKHSDPRARSGVGSATTPPPTTTITPAAAPATTVTPAPSPTATAPATTATTVPPTTTDAGTLPQTTQLPAAADALFQARVRDLWRAVVDGNPAEAHSFFFPLSAYIQVKGISDPVHDYQTRLIANFDQDVQSLHASLGASAGSATFTGVTVPQAAQWIVPGVEYNKGSYWRVYGTSVSYLAGGRNRSFPITSMISWRGEWYVVHLGAIR
jgi:hypothetical protein